MPPAGQQPDSYAEYDPILAGARAGIPWVNNAYVPDEQLLGALLTIPVKNGVTIRSGRFPKALDVWIAHELRRAGFDADSVWPRAGRPRVLPRALKSVLTHLPRTDQAALMARLVRRQGSGLPTEAYVLGEFKSKQVDVLMAEWDRGAELMVTTKTMSSSEANNIPNRYEEYIGEIRNLRGRFPLASIGLVWLVRSTIADHHLETLVDVVRKLRDMREPHGYDAGAVVVAEWDAQLTVSIQQGRVPHDMDVGPFMEHLVDALLLRTPLDNHIHARTLRP